MSTEARIVHHLAGRCRLRLPGARGDVDFFRQLAPALAAALDGASVETNPATGSVLLTGRVPSVEQLARFGRQDGWFELRDTNAQAGPADAASRLFADFDFGAIDFRGMSSRRFLALLFLALAGVQVARGQVMAPAASFLWYALDVGGFDAGAD